MPCRPLTKKAASVDGSGAESPPATSTTQRAPFIGTKVCVPSTCRSISCHGPAGSRGAATNSDRHGMPPAAFSASSLSPSMRRLLPPLIGRPAVAA